MDLLPVIVEIVRDAVGEGLITSLSPSSFEDQINNLSGPELEDFLQNLWDEL
jgi:hypothetical protein